MHELKKNYFMRTAVLLLVCGMFGLCLVPSTMSRYIASNNANGAAVRAGIFRVGVQKDANSWVFLGEGSSGDTIKIDLFSTLYEAFQDAPIVPPAGTAQENSESGVQPHIMTKPGLMDSTYEDYAIIAPGCGGQFDIKVKNFSEVEVKVDVYQASLVVTNGGTLPIEWWDKSTSSWQSVFPGLAGAIPSGGAITGNLISYPAAVGPLAVENEGTYTFYWRWKFERGTAPTGSIWYWGDDVLDTDLGAGGTTLTPGAVTYSIPLTVTAEQID
ncbi:MAG: hypothetical protein FWC27_11245 [Firmicutes bacterium]|nr:hypothetical protein [Bacillota bacterium]